MRISRPWRIAVAGAGAAAILAGVAGAATASDGIKLNDRVQPIEIDSNYEAGLGGGAADSENSPESADSAGESPFDSAGSAADSPGDPKWTDPSPESADSGAESANDSPAPVRKTKAKPAADSADSPVARRGGGGDSGDSPAQRRGGGGGSANSGDSGGSADSGD